VVTFGGASARITQRGDGKFKVAWREGGRGISTTASTLVRAREMARAKVRALSSRAGTRSVPVIEAEALTALGKLAGGRSIPALVDQLVDLAERAGGLAHFTRAVENYVRGGYGRLERVPAAAAVERFLGLHETGMYRRGLQKELRAFAAVYGAVGIADVDAALLAGWIGRENADGSAPGWRYFNNRLATWKTFLNRCREWRLLVRDEDHAGEIVKPKRKEDRVPEIWSVELAREILRLCAAELPQSLVYLVTGCFMGLRPFEMHRVTPAMWDWERGYLDVGAEVAMKTMQQRFVPIPPNVRAMLYERLTTPQRWGVKVTRPAAFIVRADDQAFLSTLLRARGLITEWPQDVMRHSYISYRLAQGHGRGQVAEWAGNSESEIRRSYRRPLRKEDGDGWFALKC